MEGMYLYVAADKELDGLPELLLEKFGRPRLVTKLLLRPEKKLAQADVMKVIAAIREQGFYLQMPPAKESYLQELPINQ